MSMEVHVFSDRQLPSIAAWQQAIDAEGFDLKLDPGVQLAEASGFLPARLHGKQSGFEAYHDDASDLMAACMEIPDVRFARAWKFAISFRWGSLFHEGASAYMAATAYARATDGEVFDPEEGRILTLAEARAAAAGMEKFAEQG